MNNKKNFKAIIATLLLAFVGLFAVSCQRDEQPVKPKNELDEKGHDNWTRVEIIVREGHLHGSNFHANPLEVDIDSTDGILYLPKEQKIIFKQDENGAVTRHREDVQVLKINNKFVQKYVKRDPMHPIEVVTGTKLDNQGQPASTRYSMEIVYYNGQERINSQFLTPEQIDYHQHFFTTKEYANWITGEQVSSNRYLADELYEYTYRDTNPEDKMIKTRTNPNGSELSNNPVGLKGYFYFAKNHAKFDMTIRLAHLFVSKYKNGQVSPANNPSAELLTNGTSDFLQAIPFVVVGDKSNFDNFNESAAKYYKTNESVIEDYLFADSVGSAESSNFWM